jgi:hypothetical protein
MALAAADSTDSFTKRMNKEEILDAIQRLYAALGSIK